jgi:hypothetical protein
LSNIEREVQKKPQEWANLMGQLLDNVFGKDMSVTYEFKDFTIDLSNAVVSTDRKLGSGQWKVNGKIIISAAAHKEREPGE